MGLRWLVMVGASLVGAFSCGGTNNSAVTPPGPTEPDPMSLDFDGDGIPNLFDLCAGPKEDGVGAVDGCPGVAAGGSSVAPRPTGGDAAKPPTTAPSAPTEAPAAALTDNTIVIRDKIQFAYNASEILDVSKPTVQAVAALLKQHPEIELLECGGHADQRGSDAHNLQLTSARAHAVVKALIDEKVGPERLRPAGYGARCLLDSSGDEVAHAKNRRVEFTVIVRGGKPTGERGGCKAQLGEEAPAPEPDANGSAPPDPSATGPGEVTGPNGQPAPKSPAPRGKGCMFECQCDRGSAYWCVQMIYNSKGAAKQRFTERACELGDAFSCTLAGGAYDRGELGVTTDPDKAITLYERSLELGFTGAAYHLGTSLEMRDKPGDQERAVAVFTTGCDLEEPSSCRLLGEALAAGRGVARDPKKAAERFVEACRLADPNGCREYAKLYADGVRKELRPRAVFAARRALRVAAQPGWQGSESDAKTVREALAILTPDLPASCDPMSATACEKSCEAGDADSCSRLGALLLYGRGIARDERRAQNLFVAACRAGSIEACNLGANSGGKELRDAFGDDLRVACRAKHYPSCTNLAIRLEGTPRQLYEVACKGGESMACAIEGLWAARGRVPNPEAIEAKVRPACLAGAGAICGMFADIFTTSKTIASPEKANEYRKLACASGAAWDCAR